MYVGNVATGVTSDMIKGIFGHFGVVLKVMCQTSSEKSFAFVQFADAMTASLAITAMNGVNIAGREIRTGWSNHGNGGDAAALVGELPGDADQRIINARTAAANLVVAGGSAANLLQAGYGTQGASSFSNKLGWEGGYGSLENEENMKISPKQRVAMMEKLASRAGFDMSELGGNAGKIKIKTTKVLKISHCFDAANETEEGWALEIKEDMQNECGKYGKVRDVLVKDKDVGGVVYVEFEEDESAVACAGAMNGRFFGGEQLEVEYVEEVNG